MAPATIKPRRPWLAALLSFFFSALGHVYAGSFWRFLAYWLAGLLLVSPLALASIVLPLGRFGLVLMLALPLGYAIFLGVDGYRLARRNREAPLKRYQRWWVYVLLIVLIAVANGVVSPLLKRYVAESYLVPTRAMMPTIQAGDRILVDKFTAGAGQLERGDVVAYYSRGPGSPIFIMRVAGLPGDEVEVRDGQLLLNGEPAEDPHAFLDPQFQPNLALENRGPVTVPADHFFALGDHRWMAFDSRFTGPVPLADVVGKARMVLWSRERIFPDPHDSSNFKQGRIAWERSGQRLD